MIELTKEQAVTLYESGWWVGKSARDIATFQMSVKDMLLCCPFGVFHEALETALGRPVYTHEMGLNWAGIVREFNGYAPAPTLEQVLDLIPADKRVLLLEVQS